MALWFISVSKNTHLTSQHLSLKMISVLVGLLEDGRKMLKE